MSDIDVHADEPRERLEAIADPEAVATGSDEAPVDVDPADLAEQQRDVDLSEDEER